MKRMMADPANVDGVLRKCTDKAGATAAAHLREVQDIVGLLRP